MNNINLDQLENPVRLAVGSYWRGSGIGSAVNLMGYIMGDELVMYPKCIATPLSIMVQGLNDHLGHVAGYVMSPQDGSCYQVLSADHAKIAIDIAWQAVGTADDPSVTVAWLNDLVDHLGNPRWLRGRVERVTPKVQKLMSEERLHSHLIFLYRFGHCNTVGRTSKISTADHIEITRWAVERWRQLQGLGEAPALDAAKIDSALAEMYTTIEGKEMYVPHVKR